MKPDGAGFTVCLDDKPLKTPAGAPVLLLHKKLADALAEEWRDQGERFDARTLALTRIVNAGIDHISLHREKVVMELTRFGQTDLICYYAEGPPDLAQRQAEHWRPLLEWAGDALRAPLNSGLGIQPVGQPAASLEALRGHIAQFEDVSLAALHQAASLCGSIIIALALSLGRLSREATWAAARVDEDWQAEQWGHDEEAARRVEDRQAALNAAAFVLDACRS